MSWQSKISKKSVLNSDSQSVRRSMFKPRGFSPRTMENDSISPMTGKYAMPDYSKVDFSPRAQPLLQPKLTVGAPGDKYEQEADNMASKVMSMPDSAVQRMAPSEQTEEEVQTKQDAAGITPLVQREAAPEEEEIQTKPLGNSAIQREEMPEENEEIQTKPLGNSTIQREEMPEENDEIQTKPLSASIQREISQEEEEVQTKPSLQRATDGSFQAGGNIESQLNNSKGGGSPLSDEVRSFMEPRFGADFSSVRVHTGDDAVQMNRELGAQAFTHGSDVYFGAGKAPGNNELTAHELTHVVQQTGYVQTKLSPAVQRKCSVCEEEETEVQRAPNVLAVPELKVQRWSLFGNNEDKTDTENSSGEGILDWAKQKASGVVDSVMETGGEVVDWAKQKANKAVETIREAGGGSVDWDEQQKGNPIESPIQSNDEVDENCDPSVASCPVKQCDPIPKGPGNHPKTVSDTLIDRMMGKYAHKDGDPGEGCQEEPYIAGATESVCTIGFGHQIKGCPIIDENTGEEPTQEKRKQALNLPPKKMASVGLICACAGQEKYDCKGGQAKEKLEKDAKIKVDHVHEVVPVDLNQAEFDALVDIALHHGSVPGDLLQAISLYWCTDAGKDYVRTLYLNTRLTRKGSTKIEKNFVNRRKHRVWSASLPENK